MRRNQNITDRRTLRNLAGEDVEAQKDLFETKQQDQKQSRSSDPRPDSTSSWGPVGHRPW